MRIISYNMRHGGKKGAESAWHHLNSKLEPDLVFAQESRDPCRELSLGSEVHGSGCFWRRVDDRDWGSAIFSPRATMEPVSLGGFGGWVTGARIPDLPIGETRHSVTAFSIHVPAPKPYEEVVGLILDEIANAWDRETSLILAGDFNITTARRLKDEHTRNSRQELAILERMKQDFGISNVWQVLHPGEPLPQTLRWSRNPGTPYHCDGIFMSSSLLAHVVSAHVETSDFWTRTSDHNPLVISMT